MFSTAITPWWEATWAKSILLVTSPTAYILSTVVFKYSSTLIPLFSFFIPIFSKSNPPKLASLPVAANIFSALTSLVSPFFRYLTL